MANLIEVPPDELRKAVEKLHGGNAELIQSVPVSESFNGQLVWEGIVHVFKLTGHPKATRAYAWSEPVNGSTKRRVHAVIEGGAIMSPVDAVRAAIVAENRAK